MNKRKYNSKFRKEYKKYSTEFNRLLEKTGKDGSEKLTFQEFKRAFKVESEEELSGRIKVSRNLSKKIAEQSFYEFSYREARMIRKYAIEQGVEGAEKVRIYEIRQGLKEEFEDAFYDAIREERESLFSAGLNKSEVRREISIRFFDSDPKKRRR